MAKNRGNVLAVIALVCCTVLALGMIAQGRDKGDSQTGTTSQTTSSSSSPEESVPEPSVPTVTYAEYPFDSSFENAAIWYGTNTASAESNVQTLTLDFSYQDDGADDEYVSDFSSVSYLVVNYKNVTGAPGIKVTIYDTDGNAHTMSDGARYYTWTDGTFDPKTAPSGVVENDYVTIESGFNGALVFDLLWFGEFDASARQVDKITFTTDAMNNYGFQVWVGELGALKQDGSYTTVFTTFDMLNTGRTTLTAQNDAEKGILDYNFI